MRDGTPIFILKIDWTIYVIIMVIYVINMIFLRASFECRGSIPKKILGVGGWEVINGKLLKESAHRKY